MNKYSKVLVLIVIGLVAFSLQAHALSLVVQPDNGKDTQLYASNPDSNYGTFHSIITNWADGNSSWGLLEFDLSPISGYIVTNATLSLYHSTNAANGATFSVYKVNESWGELTATWNNAPAYTSTASSSITISDDLTGWRDWNVTSLVQDWASGSYNNYGMLVKRTDQTRPVAYFDSSDLGRTNDPKLSVEYVIPEPASMLLLGLGLFGMGVLRKKS